MHTYQSFGEMKATARKSLEGNYGRAISMYINVRILGLLPSYITLLFFSESNIFQIVGSEIVRFILLAFLQVLQVGVCLFYLKLTCSQTASMSDLFHGFRNNRNKALTLGIIFTAISYLCLLPATIFSYNTSIPLYTYYFTLAAGTLAASLLLLPFRQCYYILLDFPSLSVRQILLRSIRLMRGNIFRYILFSISFIPLLLLSFLSFGIGLLWVIPYMEASRTIFYLDLARKHNNS